MEWSYDSPKEAVWTKPPMGWTWQSCPGRLLAEESLQHTLRDTDWGLLKRDQNGFFLAFPWMERAPFPIPPLMCLCRVERLEGRWYSVFRFSRRGWAQPLHNISAGGEDRAGT